MVGNDVGRLVRGINGVHLQTLSKLPPHFRSQLHLYAFFVVTAVSPCSIEFLLR